MTFIEAYVRDSVGPDEAVHDGAVHASYADVMAVLERLGADELRERATQRDVLQWEHRMTFPLPGSEEARLLPLDLVPRLVQAVEWDLIARGLVQRARTLTALLVDLAGGSDIVDAGIIPASLVPAGPLLGPGPARAPATIAGMDLLRTADGWHVLEDNLRVPSGLGYALLVRNIVSSVLPELGGHAATANPADAIPLLKQALLAAAPVHSNDEPRLAVLTAGPADSAYAEHALLAERLDVPLVMPSELRLAGDGSLDGIDVLYRRLDQDELDAELLGALTTAVRNGRLGLANALGTGVADDKAVYAYVPAAMKFYLGEEPLLPDVHTWALADPDSLAEVLPRLAELVLKPVDGYGGKGVTFGAHLDGRELGELEQTLRDNPAGWVAQEPLLATTHPTLSNSGALESCAVDLRAFVVAGVDAAGETGLDRAVTLPAALTRVAPPGSRVVNSSQGGGTKDTWLGI